jgi:hypothetical protein
LDPFWTYELCHGLHIRQYHDAKVAGKVRIYFYYQENQEECLLILEIDSSRIFLRLLSSG